MFIAILGALVSTSVAIVALYGKDHRPKADAGRIQRGLRLNRKGLVLLSLAGVSTVLSVAQVASGAGEAAEAKNSQENAQHLLETSVVQVEHANNEILGLKDKLRALRDEKIRSLESNLTEAVRLAKAIDGKAVHTGGTLSEYIMDLRTDPNNMHFAVDDLRSRSTEIRGYVAQICNLKGVGD